MFSARKICENFVSVNYCFPENSTTKNAFLAVCRFIDENVDLNEVNAKAPFGGKLGPGDSKLDNYLNCSKILRLHAIFHDAYGYIVTKAQSFRNNTLLGHFSGISYWIFVKLFHREHFDAFPF